MLPTLPFAAVTELPAILTGLFVVLLAVRLGEVGIIVAGIGASAGVIDAQLFAAIVGMSVLTTVVVPPLLRRALTADPSLAVRGEEKSLRRDAGRVAY